MSLDTIRFKNQLNLLIIWIYKSVKFTNNIDSLQFVVK